MNAQPDMTIRFNAELGSFISQEIEIRSLPSASRKRIFKNAGRVYLKASRDHIRQQKTVTGQAMKKKQYGKGKALKNMGKDLKFNASSKRVQVTWPNKGVAKLGFRHQFGIPEVFTASKMAKIHGNPDYQQPASKKQAKALLQEGFRIKTADRYKSGTNKGKAKSKKPSQKWILENMKIGQAGLILRALRREERPPRRWTIKVPERAFLGMPGGDASDILTREIVRERERRSRS